MSADLALLAVSPSDIDIAADPGAFVVLACERAKSWLTEALAHGDIEQIVELKSQAEAIRVYTMQKQVGKDAELAATEIVRRAERGIGVCIRKGQEAGEIRDQHSGRPDRPAHGLVDNKSMASPTDYAPQHELSGNDGAGIYAMTDNVPDDQFEAAIVEAKAEQNLSRANVVRKVKDEPAKSKSERPEHLRKTRRHDANRIVEQTVIALEGLCLGVELIDYAEIDPLRIPAWQESLRASLRVLNRLGREIAR